jgi:CRP-like cAMP-binding protein
MGASWDPVKHSPKQNHLLGALSEADYEYLRPQMELVEMPLGAVLYESGSRMTYAYFPTSGIVSLLYVSEDGGSAEIAITGNDGLVGLATLLGGGTTPSRAIVQIPGYAYRVEAAVLLNSFQRGGALQLLLLRYVQALMTQMSQTAVCNRHHSVEQQLCRWLLRGLDRMESNEVTMTQELISNMLGVRRVGVTDAAKHLRKDGLIKYRRGRITVPDRSKLEARACECYGVVKRESDRLLPGKACV